MLEINVIIAIEITIALVLDSVQILAAAIGFLTAMNLSTDMADRMSPDVMLVAQTT